MDKYFEHFIYNFGEPTSEKTVDTSSIESYRGKLPATLLKYWKQYGFCGFKNGLYWIVDPSRYESVLNSWIGDTKIIEQDNYYVIARSGFGELYLWGTKTGHKYTITPSLGWILEEDGAELEIKNEGADFVLQRFFAVQEVKNAELKDLNTNELLFDPAVKKFGALKENEVFGFEPALFLGGKQTIDNLKKLDIQTHLSILADFGHREFIDEDELARRAFGD